MHDVASTTLEAARAAGCDIGQGFLLGRPMAAPLLMARLADESAFLDVR